MSAHKKKKRSQHNSVNRSPTIAILIPCHNEELGIKASLSSCLNQTIPFNQIIVVDDASTDNTVKVIEKNFKKYIQKKFITLIKLTKNKGNKSYVQEHGLQFVTTDYLVCTDGDTILDPKFVANTMPHFNNPACVAVAGHVQSLKDNWLTACREIEYTITQLLHKKAQHYTNTISVIPGCAATFRMQDFKKYVTFDHDTLTEDLDFTYKLHTTGKQIAYEPKAIVYTQDPADIRSYIRQMRRWYAGNWQNLVKHTNIIKHKPLLAIEVILTYTESTLLAVFILLVPLMSLRYFFLMLMGYIVVAYSCALICLARTGRKDVIWFAPAICIIVVINSFLFLREGFRAVILHQKEMIWHRATRKEII